MNITTANPATEFATQLAHLVAKYVEPEEIEQVSRDFSQTPTGTTLPPSEQHVNGMLTVMAKRLSRDKYQYFVADIFTLNQQANALPRGFFDAERIMQLYFDVSMPSPLGTDFNKDAGGKLARSQTLRTALLGKMAGEADGSSGDPSPFVINGQHVEVKRAATFLSLSGDEAAVV